MREDYDLKRLRVKRRGPLRGLEGAEPESAKVRVTIALDRDVVAHFKAEAGKPGALPYQTQINRALRRVAFGEDGGTEAVKAALLDDNDFLSAVADAVDRRHHA
jgi:predicted DNA binding CopG/RHH family protein